MRAYERLLKYVAIPTPSDEHSTSTPTSARQFDLARLLADEMTGMGLADVRLDERCYVYAKLPATEGCERAVKIAVFVRIDECQIKMCETAHINRIKFLKIPCRKVSDNSCISLLVGCAASSNNNSNYYKYDKQQYFLSL